MIFALGTARAPLVNHPRGSLPIDRELHRPVACGSGCPVVLQVPPPTPRARRMYVRCTR